MVNRVLVLALALACARVAGAVDDPSLLNVQAKQLADTKDVAASAATVTLTSEGGYRWAKTESIAIAPGKSGASVTIERRSYNPHKPPQGPKEIAVSQADYDALVKTLETNGALTLKDDLSMKRRATDLPEYVVTISLSGKANQFRVFGPEILHDAHTTVVGAIEALAAKALPAPRM